MVCDELRVGSRRSEDMGKMRGNDREYCYPFVKVHGSERDSCGYGLASFVWHTIFSDQWLPCDKKA
jgi:hypothetical protein